MGEKVGVVRCALAWVDAMDKRDHEETTVKFAGHASVEWCGGDDDVGGVVAAAGDEEVVAGGNTSVVGRAGDIAVRVQVGVVQLVAGNAVAAAVDVQNVGAVAAGDYGVLVALVHGRDARGAVEAVADGHGSPH